MEPLFSPVRPKPLRAEVVDMLRDAIINGKLQPGQHLKENDIADQMSVSRSPIREALRQLEQEGLIVSIPNQGCFVRRFEESDIEEVFSLRTALESLACEILISDQLLGPAELDTLEQLIEQQAKATLEEDLERLVALDMDFHQFLCQSAKRERLLKMWQSLRAQMQVLFRMRFTARPSCVPQTVCPDHRAILEALRKGDAEECSRIHRSINIQVSRDCREATRALEVTTGA